MGCPLATYIKEGEEEAGGHGGRATRGVLPGLLVLVGFGPHLLSVGNNTYGITRIPTTVSGRGVLRRAGLLISTKIIYPGSGREDA